MERINRRKFLTLMGIGGVSLLLTAADKGHMSAKLTPDDSIPTPDFAPTPTVEISTNLFDQLIKPLIQEATKRRAYRISHEANYQWQIDQQFNQDRLNILLYSYGETHEPPLTERETIGSFTIFSYNYLLRKIDLVSLTHDIRAPEIERYQRAKGEAKIYPERISLAYQIGGFTLMRQVLESATGLSVDFQIVFDDATLARIIDDAFQNIEVEVPQNFAVYPFYLRGKKYEEGYFEKGKQKMDGIRVIQFIKTVPIKNTDKEIEHNARKHLVFKSLLKSAQDYRSNPLFWMRTGWALKNETDEGNFTSDFDLTSLVISNLGLIGQNIPRFLFGGSSEMPEIAQTIYIVDPASGDGGVQWVRANANINPITKRDLEQGVYPDPAIEVPYSSTTNPYGEDLVESYWPAVRSQIKKLLN